MHHNIHMTLRYGELAGDAVVVVFLVNICTDLSTYTRQCIAVRLEVTIGVVIIITITWSIITLTSKLQPHQ